MDLQFITRHLICGLIPETAALVLYFIVLHLLGKKQNLGHIIASFVFCIYLIGILTATGICIRGSFSPRIVYTPFLDMIRGPVDTFLNILLFVPMGFLLPILYKKYNNFATVAIIGFLISLSIEITQLFGYGATDINDLITNTAGTCIGYWIFRLLVNYIPSSWIRKIQVDGPQCYYELPLFWIGSTVIMMTLQLQIFHALFLSRYSNGEIQKWD